MYKFLFKLAVPIAVMLYILGVISWGMAKDKLEVGAEVETGIKNLSSSDEISKRIRAGDNLIIYINELTKKEKLEIDLSHIKNLEDLLKDNNEVIRIYAARILGMFGRQARASLPALQLALQNEPPPFRGTGTFGPSVSARDTIKIAIREILEDR